MLRGNAAILKCHISTFVTEYVSVSSWIVSEGETDELEIKADSNDIGIICTRSIHLLTLNPFLCILKSILEFTVFFSGFTSVHGKLDGRECFTWEFGNRQMPHTQLRHGICYGLVLDNIRRRCR